MGLFGRGIAFNNCFIRRAPLRPPMIGGGMHMPTSSPISFRFRQTFTYKTNFWDFANTLLQTYAMTSMMFGGWGASRAVASTSTPQGTTTNINNADSLRKLRSLFAAKKVNIEEIDGKYTATDENGDIIAQDLTFNEMSKALGDYKRNKTKESDDSAKVVDDEAKVAKDNDDSAKEKDDLDNDQENAGAARSGGTRKARSRGSAQKPVKTIKGNNGYYVEIYKDGTKKYFDNLGHPTGETEFAHNCPNIHASVTKNDPVNKAEEAKYKNSPQKVSISMDVHWKFGEIIYTATGFIRDFKGNKIPIKVSNKYFSPKGLSITGDSAMQSAVEDARGKLAEAGRQVGYPNLLFNFPKS